MQTVNSVSVYTKAMHPGQIPSTTHISLFQGQPLSISIVNLACCWASQNNMEEKRIVSAAIKCLSLFAAISVLAAITSITLMWWAAYKSGRLDAGGGKSLGQKGQRKMLCGDMAQQHNLYPFILASLWGPWSDPTECTALCGGGERFFFRDCFVDNKALEIGNDCIGRENKAVTCADKICESHFKNA